MVGVESELGQTGPKWGAWKWMGWKDSFGKEKHKVSLDVNKDVLCWGQRRRGQGQIWRAEEERRVMGVEANMELRAENLGT